MVSGENCSAKGSPFQRIQPLRRRLHRGGLVRCGYLRIRECPQGRTSFTVKACFEDVLSESRETYGLCRNSVQKMCLGMIMYVCKYLSMYLCTNVCTNVVCTYVCIYVCMYV